MKRNERRRLKTEISLRRSVCSRAETRAKESKMGEETKKLEEK